MRKLIKAEIVPNSLCLDGMLGLPISNTKGPRKQLLAMKSGNSVVVVTPEVIPLPPDVILQDSAAKKTTFGLRRWPREK